ncbi:GGDEF domain-containing protein [Stenotrophomonas sp. MMGLT7]|uniref:GGDEF domain-containing protein n=1 Tax=Stenotrophomonas sp. MMGLT7 TaxID=2901227 RepID=UPI001E648A78|nr:GGDEF domain-containing protein [Stenotrophomonas sp. MMGLT7]MCD7097989.1 diguanylate cyclase [Stenotrophomonas sp. MMGLT7]
MSEEHGQPPRAPGGLRRLLSRRPGPAVAASASVIEGDSRRLAPAARPAAAAPASDAAALRRLFAEAHKPEALLCAFADGMAGLHGELRDMGLRLQAAHAGGDWPGYGRALRQLIDKYIRTIDLDSADDGGSDAERLRDLLRHTLGAALATLLQQAPPLAAEAQAIGGALRHWQPRQPLQPLEARVRELCHQVGLRGEDVQEQQTLLLGLFDLLLENVGELLDDRSWLQGQISAVRDLIAGPIERGAIEQARNGLREVIYRQGLLKQGIAESKAAMKELMVSFVDRLGSMAASTGEFHDRISDHSQAIAEARSIADLNRLLQELLADTGRVQEQALRSRDHLLAARAQVDEAEQRIARLEQELRDVAGLVREDQLTGALNRRGLDELYRREAARTERSGQPLCLAMLDLDDFRRINELHGHAGGDAALQYLVQVMHTALRSSDAVVRHGGEEFVLLLPDSTLFEATAAVTRVQRALAQRSLLFEDVRIFLTFSAGVALRAPGETQEDLLRRADAAMYEAKKAGKNRIVNAD